jgi:hypothetical protein
LRQVRGTAFCAYQLITASTAGVMLLTCSSLLNNSSQYVFSVYCC